MKQDDWRQANPKDQLKVILWSIEGDISNMEEGITPSARTCERIAAMLQAAKDIIKHYMPTGTWGKETLSYLMDVGTVLGQMGQAYDETRKEKVWTMTIEDRNRLVSRTWELYDERVPRNATQEVDSSSDGIGRLLSQVD